LPKINEKKPERNPEDSKDNFYGLAINP
jgi:hypothetical protein